MTTRGSILHDSDHALPPLSTDEQAHSTRLIHCIRDEIDARGGWISSERFMEMALYEPALGYYSAGAIKLGRAVNSSRHRDVAIVQPLPGPPVRGRPGAARIGQHSRTGRGLRDHGQGRTSCWSSRRWIDCPRRT